MKADILYLLVDLPSGFDHYQAKITLKLNNTLLWFMVLGSSPDPKNTNFIY